MFNAQPMMFQIYSVIKIPSHKLRCTHTHTIMQSVHPLCIRIHHEAFCMHGMASRIHLVPHSTSIQPPVHPPTMYTCNALTSHRPMPCTHTWHHVQCSTHDVSRSINQSNKMKDYSRAACRHSTSINILGAA